MKVGDVLLVGQTELWLAGQLELVEEEFVARLFATPGSALGDWLVQLDPEGRDLAVLRGTAEVPDGAVPEALPIGGRRLTLERRGAATVQGSGEHLPRMSPRAAYCLLSEVGGRVALVLDFERAPRLSLAGERVMRDAIDLLPGGDVEQAG